MRAPGELMKELEPSFERVRHHVCAANVCGIVV
jgi:hypothetical protein